MTVMKDLVKMLEKLNFRLCSIFLVDSQFMIDSSKFISGTMAALCVMTNLELPHVNILTKIDLLSKSSRKKLDTYLDVDTNALLDETEDDPWYEKYRKLTNSIVELIENYSMVKFYPLNIQDEESISDIMMLINNIIQFGEDAEVKMKDYGDDDQNNDD